ncbi:transmembrane protein 237A isoform X2 [Pygocentrus nattereri]|uniref:transmembrane protein 237A isoform X2 n=1 Tax=Pygocentrus nattereri TaxID=42514 RepID=UPI001891CE40|nr:transmembrane protein 237A isoform X2 [Pygocentrus nattereri]
MASEQLRATLLLPPHHHIQHHDSDLNTMGRKQARGVPPMPSQETGDEMPIAKPKKRKVKKEISDVDDPDGTEPALEMEGLVSHVESENRDTVSPEPQDIPPQRKKKKKKTHTFDMEGEQQDLANGDAREAQTDGEGVPRKSKRKRKAKITENQYTSELGVEEDDIVTDAHTPISHRSLFSAPLGHSQPLSKVFVERSRRFQARDRLDLTREQLEEFMEVRPLWNTRDVAMRVHSGFRIIGLFSHGFLAGYAVWNIIVVYVLAGEQLTTLPNLLQQYHSLAYPAQSLLYLLLAISTVSAFDRVNLAKASMALRGFLTLDPAALASFLYFAALILSLSQQMTSDRINLYPTANETLWPPGSEHQILQPWIVVNLVVALLVGLAWIFVSTRPDMDYTEEFLMGMEVDEYPQHEDKTEIAA